MSRRSSQKQFDEQDYAILGTIGDQRLVLRVDGQRWQGARSAARCLPPPQIATRRHPNAPISRWCWRIVVGQVGRVVAVQIQGDLLADVSGTVHHGDVPAGCVLGCQLQVGVGGVEIGDVRVTGAVQSKTAVLADIAELSTTITCQPVGSWVATFRSPLPGS